MDGIEPDVELSKCPFGVSALFAFCGQWLTIGRFCKQCSFMLLPAVRACATPPASPHLQSAVASFGFILLAAGTPWGCSMTRHLCLCGPFSITY